MTYMVSVTSQGQISIPVSLRRRLGFNKNKKALVTEKEGELLIKPVKDLLDLRGSFKTNIKLSSKKVRQAFEEYLGSRAMLKLR